ncbi:MAG: hypothetical protein KZQ80_14185 [Candidatus Thiodiazotropha sp. (ex Monitilora ramsayi)]|nr:hypothetical protein [Candidatus Thiodiazotropha sp. (ex Monitilora ramsayi)]
MEPSQPNNQSDSTIQDNILSELKKSNELLEKLLKKIQSNVQIRQRKFWVIAVTQVALVVVAILWIGSKYGF